MITIEQIFDNYQSDVNKIYQEMTLIKESSNDYNLVLEGFWDKVKGAAKNIGGKIGKTAANVVNSFDKTKDSASKSIDKTKEKGTEAIDKAGNFLNKAYNKGKELGNNMLELGKKLYNDVSNWVLQSIDYIKKTPHKIISIIKDMFTRIQNKCAQLYSDAKKKGGEWFETAKKNINKLFILIGSKLASLYSFIKNWLIKTGDKSLSMLHDLDDEIRSANDVLVDGIRDNTQKAINFCKASYKKIKEKTIDFSKKAGMIALVLIIIPFVITFKTLKKSVEMTEDAINFIEAGINSIKTNLGEAWGELVENATEEYKSNRKPKVESRTHILDFETFIREYYRY